MKYVLAIALLALLFCSLLGDGLNKDVLDRRLAKATDLDRLTILKELYTHQDNLTSFEYLEYAQLELETARRTASSKQVAEALANMAYCHYEMRQYEESLDFYFQARSLFQENGQPDEMARMNAEIGNLFFFTYSDHQRALSFYGQSAELYRTNGNKEQHYRVLNNTAEIHYQIGETDKATRLYLKALDICESLAANEHNLGRAASIRINLARIYFQLGDTIRAETMLQDALDVNRRLPNRPTHVAAALELFGEFSLRKKQYQNALEFDKQALAIYKSLNYQERFHDRQATVLYHIGVVHSAAGEQALALTHLEAALSKWEALKDVINQSRTLFAMGQAYQRSGQTDRAHQLYEESLNQCRSLGFHRELVQMYSQMATFYAEMGNTKQELQCRRLGSELQHQLDMPTISAQTAALLARYEEAKQTALVRTNLIGWIFGSLFILFITGFLLHLTRRKLKRFRLWTGRILSIKDQQLFEKKKLLSELQKRIESLQPLPCNLSYKSPPPSEEKTEKVLNTLFRLMKDEQLFLDSEITLKSLSCRAQTNSTTLSRVLNERLEIGFNDFIYHYRIEKAKAIMGAPDVDSWSIVDICFEVGFNSVPTFYRAFKKHTGQSPAEYQKQAQRTCSEESLPTSLRE